MSRVSLEEEIAVALAYGITAPMAAMGAAQSVSIQEQQTGNLHAALWAAALTGLGRRLIAYKTAELIVQRETGAKQEGAKVSMARELRESTSSLSQQIRHVLKRRARRGKKGGQFNEQERCLIAMVAIEEYSHDYCRACQGAGEIPVAEGLEGSQPMQTCPVCNGKPGHRFTDRERETAFLRWAKDLQYEFATSGNLVAQVGMARAIIRLACRTAVLEWKRNYG